MRYSMASSSMSHTLGNVTSFVNNYLIGLFPKNYFKTNYINSSIAYKDFATYNNNRKQFIKKNKPMLLIRPRFDISEQFELGINNTLFANRLFNSMNEDMSTGNLQPFIHDPDNNRQVSFLLNAFRVHFDVSLVVETYMEQLNLVNYFRNRVIIDRWFDMVVDLESFISRDIMYLLAQDAGYGDIINDSSKLGDFLSYVNNNSHYPVTVKYRNASGRNEFFRYHPSHMNILISSLSMDDGNKKNQITDDYVINFTVSAEFNTAGLYVLTAENDELFDNYTPSGDGITEDTEIVPIVTPQKVFTNRTLPNGWQIYTVPQFEIDNDLHPYPLDFSVLLNTSLNEAIKYHRNNGIPLETFMHIDVTKNDRTMEMDRGEYKIDWDNLSIYVYNRNLAANYRLILSVNTLYLNDLLSDIVHFKEEK